MRFSRVSELQTGESLRCGRCADLLPDETQTFCRACGVPFSEAHPTTSFLVLSEERIRRLEAKRRLHINLLCLALFGLIWACYGAIHVLIGEQHIADLKPRMRPVEFYIHDFNQVPSLEARTKRESVLIARQAFEDHFGLELKDFSIHEEKWPSELAPFFEETRQQIEVAKPNEPLIFQIPSSRLSFWEKQVFPALTMKWKTEPKAPLKVVITNLPIYAEKNSRTSVEVSHLSNTGLISGLGHPALVLISTYRLHNDVPEFQNDRPLAKNLSEQARFLGEYVIAHELGHALLGLVDYVIPPEAYPNKAPKLRTPASFLPGASGIQHCLMHTDQGGGFRAWENLKNRDPASRPQCTAYEDNTQAFALRLQAIALLKAGQREEAEKIHSQALHLIRRSSQDWVHKEWENEHRLFLSVFNRWMSGMFMVQ